MQAVEETKRTWRDEAHRQQERQTLSEAKFQHIYDNSPVMMHSIDSDGVICNVNKMWLETTGYTRDEVIGRKADFLMTPESSSRAFATVIPQFWRDGFVRDIHYQYIKKSGEIFDVLLNCTATIDPQGRKISLSVTRDITDKLRVERELQEYQQSLEDKVRQRTAELQKTQEVMVHQARLASIGTMLSGFAHEIRNPLNFTTGGVRQLNRLVQEVETRTPRSLGDELMLKKMHQSLRLIHEGSDRIAGIVTNLQTFSETREHPREEPCCLNGSIQATLTLLRGLLERHLIQVHWEKSELPEVRSNPIELKQVLFNLLHNACQAMPDGGVITIDTKQNARSEVVCVVSDNGPGIPAEHRNQIFDPFYTTREPGEGTGLGLSIAHSIVQRHGGELTLLAPASGAAFQVILQPISTH